MTINSIIIMIIIIMIIISLYFDSKISYTVQPLMLCLSNTDFDVELASQFTQAVLHMYKV